MDHIRRIVVPVDFSPFSKLALRAGLRMARLCQAELHLLHVVPEYELPTAFHIRLPDRKELEARARKWAAREFENYLRGEPVEGVQIVRAVAYGNPAREICAYATGVGADLILIASHGRSGFERAVFGSVAEKVLRLAEQAVMVVKAA